MLAINNNLWKGLGPWKFLQNKTHLKIFAELLVGKLYFFLLAQKFCFFTMYAVWFTKNFCFHIILLINYF